MQDMNSLKFITKGRYWVSSTALFRANSGQCGWTDVCHSIALDAVTGFSNTEVIKYAW